MRSYLKTKDFSVSKETFSLLFDDEKEMLVTSPQPNNVDKYYDSPNYISHTDSKKTFFDRTYQYIKSYNLKKKVRLINSLSNEQKTLLDIGSGTGDFLLTAKKSGWQVKGVEPNELARNKSSEKQIDVLPSFKDLSGEKFQVITLWHVLEHFVNLEEAISKIESLLTRDGVLIVAVPNFKSFDANHYKTYWAAYDVPRHLWHFSKKSIELIFSEFGFKLIQVEPMWFDAFYVSILSEKYKGSKLSFVKGVLIGLFSNASALFTKEYSSHIYVLKKA